MPLHKCAHMRVCVLRTTDRKTSLIGPDALVGTLSSAGPRLLWPATPLSWLVFYECFSHIQDSGVGGVEDVSYRLSAVVKLPEQSQSSWSWNMCPLWKGEWWGEQMDNMDSIASPNTLLTRSSSRMSLRHVRPAYKNALRSHRYWMCVRGSVWAEFNDLVSCYNALTKMPLKFHLS